MIKCNGKDVIPRLNGKELSRVMYNGKQIYPTNNIIEVQLADVIAGDVCVYDGTNKRFFRFVNSGATDNIKNYTPIGIVVIPTSHDVYGDGSCAIVSLRLMDYNNPSEGTNEDVSIGLWGPKDIDIQSLNNYTDIAIGNTDDGLPTKVLNSNAYTPYIPFDETSSTQCKHDNNSYYGYLYSGSLCPSPYLTDGSRNPGYYQTESPSTIYNVLSDFDGVNNTKKLITERGNKNYSYWKPSNANEEDYPPASCCDMFYTKGTQQGDWYLPALGELGYFISRINKIKKSLSNIRDIYGPSFVASWYGPNGLYWSSTEADSSRTWHGDVADGSVGKAYKSNIDCVRAFCRIK